MGDDIRMDGEIDPGERIRWTRPAELPGTQVVVFENNRRVVRMFHAGFGFLSHRAGTEVLWACRGRRIRSGEGATSVWEPGDFHATLRVGLANQRGLILDPPLLESMAAELGWKGGSLHTRGPECLDRGVHSSLDRFHRAMESDCTSLERETRLFGAVRRLLATAFESGPGSGPAESAGAVVRRACDYLQDQFDRNVSLEELARAVGLGRFRLLRAFAERTGAPPHAYLVAVRLTRARELLSRGRPPAEVAAVVGFSDQSHFTRHFRRSFGYTPARFARDVAGSRGPVTRSRSSGG